MRSALVGALLALRGSSLPFAAKRARRSACGGGADADGLAASPRRAASGSARAAGSAGAHEAARREMVAALQRLGLVRDGECAADGDAPWPARRRAVNLGSFLGIALTWTLLCLAPPRSHLPLPLPLWSVAPLRHGSCVAPKHAWK
jgi:hypothetical protein